MTARATFNVGQTDRQPFGPFHGAKEDKGRKWMVVYCAVMNLLPDFSRTK